MVSTIRAMFFWLLPSRVFVLDSNLLYYLYLCFMSHLLKTKTVFCVLITENVTTRY